MTGDPRRRLVLASASPARRRLLEQAGFTPEVITSGVDESAVVLDGAEALTVELAVRKASAVAAGVDGPALVIGCDSVLDLDGAVQGKPSSPEEAVARWRAMRGRTGRLVTGHCVLDVPSGPCASAADATVVRFGSPTDAEIDAYVATGEPLAVAGAFTLDGRGAPFVDGVDGDPGTVIGLSLPLLRRLLAELDVEITSLWQ